MIDLLHEIVCSIRRNKLRTCLTGFAVAWGIFMLIVLLGAGNGLLNAMNMRMEGLPMNVIETYGGYATMPYKGMEGHRNIKLTEKELETTQSMPEVNGNVLPSIEKGNMTVTYGSESTSATLTGIMEGHMGMNAYWITHGRGINSQDNLDKRKCAVIDAKLAETLFGKQIGKAIGQYVKVNSIYFRVVGIYGSNNAEYYPTALVPYATLQSVYPQGNQVSSISFGTKGIHSENEATELEQRYRTLLSRTLHFDPSDVGAVNIWNRFSSYLQILKGNNILRTAIWVIGILTLLSGIVGVSNIMFINVKERKREFGIRKAIGAKPRQLLNMVIMESIMVTTLFGYVGLFLGILATEYMNIIAGSQSIELEFGEVTVFLNPTVDMGIAIQATLTLIIAGTLAGWFPARKAANVKPIEALRAE